ncbi:hypothetical protein OK016_21285 [Vibrio chagasii]|nr:hypothetical protein [Vibrio chagasii]
MRLREALILKPEFISLDEPYIFVSIRSSASADLLVVTTRKVRSYVPVHQSRPERRQIPMPLQIHSDESARWIEKGDTETFSAPQHEYTKQLVSLSNVGV